MHLTIKSPPSFLPDHKTRSDRVFLWVHVVAANLIVLILELVSCSHLAYNDVQFPQSLFQQLLI